MFCDRYTIKAKERSPVAAVFPIAVLKEAYQATSQACEDFLKDDSVLQEIRIKYQDLRNKYAERVLELKKLEEFKTLLEKRDKAYDDLFGVKYIMLSVNQIDPTAYEKLT